MMRGDPQNHHTGGVGYALCLVMAGVLSGCAASPPVGGPARDGRYDSFFPQQDVAGVIDRVAPAVQMVTAIAFYKVYALPEADAQTRSALSSAVLARYEAGAQFVNTVNVGAATILSLRAGEALLLTCAHVVLFPDTIVSFHPSTSGGSSPLLSSVALRVRSSVSVAILPDGGEVSVVASDEDADIALLGRHFSAPVGPGISAWDFPVGTTDELDWGTFVYVLGYPRGQLMLTHGLVSLARRPAREGFFIDAGMGRGFSGGPVLALRDGVPNVEWVGMARMMPGETSFVLAPGLDDGAVHYDPTTPYRGEAYVHRQTELHYGMARAISAESILDFLERHRETVERAGFAPIPLWRHPGAAPPE